MRRALLAALLLGSAWAGCLSGGEEGAPPADDASSGAPYGLDCGISTAGTNASWPEPCLVDAGPNDSPSQSEVDLAVNPKDPLNVVVGAKDLDPRASDCVWAVPSYSKDGGRTWTSVIIGGERSARMPGEPLYGWRCITDPIMVFDAEGTLYYSLQAYDHTLRDREVPVPEPVAGALPVGPTFGSSILMARSRDGGETFDHIVTLHAGDGTSIFHDYMRMAVNPKTGSVYTVWNQFTQPATVVPVLVASRDGGETAEPPVYVPVPDKVQEGVVMSGLAAANDGTVYLVINDGRDAYLSVSTDDAQTWTTPARFHTHEPVPRFMKNNSYRSGSGFELVVDNSGGARDGWLYVTYADYTGEDANVFVVSSADKGATWSAPVMVNQGEFARGDQWMERPFVDGRGTLHLNYFDRSRDPDNYGLDVTWAYSVDGGQTFTNRRLTATPFDGALGIHQDGGAFIGDYNGIGGAGDVVYHGFPTTITGRAEMVVAKVVATG